MSVENKKQEAIVIGAGIVGVCSAWHLSRRGYSVTIIDKKGPGEETSWGNAGLIQRECMLPYGFPKGLKNMVLMGLNMKIDINYQPLALLSHWSSLAQYWWQSRPALYEKNAKEFGSLIERCTDEHEVLIKASKAEKLVRRVGFLEVFRSRSLDDIQSFAETNRAAGVKLDVLTPQQISEKEPSVDVSQLSGGVHFTDSWQVTDPGALVKAYADNFVSRGGTILQATVHQIEKSVTTQGNWAVVTDRGTHEAPVVVVCTGPWTNDIVKPLGYKFPLYPLRGYTTHYQISDGAVLNHSVVDAENGYVLGPMKEGIRLTTGGELTSMSNQANLKQLVQNGTAAHHLLPLKDEPSGLWFGHRPCIPDMKPIIGEAPNHPGLWMNFGHGHSGFTLGPISGRLLAELVTGESPVVNHTPFSPKRFL